MGGGPKNRGYLACYEDNSYLFTIHFAAPGVPVAAPMYVPDQKAGSITVSVEEMPLYIDLVRNEKPIYAYLDSQHPHTNRITTNDEPVGEGE